MIIADRYASVIRCKMSYSDAPQSFRGPVASHWSVPVTDCTTTRRKPKAVNLPMLTWQFRYAELARHAKPSALESIDRPL